MWRTFIARLAYRFFGSADRDRLKQAIDETWSDLEDQISRTDGKGLQGPWAQNAIRNLLNAEQSLISGKFQQGWLDAQAAQRSLLANPDDTKRLIYVAMALRREAD